MKHEKNDQSTLKKYFGLILLVALFLLLTVALLGLSAWTTNRLAKNTQVINVAGEQGASIQQLSKNLMDINLYLDAQQNTTTISASDVQAASEPMATQPKQSEQIALSTLPQEALYRLQEIQQIRDRFENTLTAFEKGGVVQARDGSEVTIAAVTNNADAAHNAANIRQIWTPYLGLLDSFLSSNSGNQAALRKEVSDYLVDYSRLYNQSLLTDSSQLANALNQKAVDEANWLAKIQLGGIVVAVVLFLLIVFGALRQLMAGDRQLAIANQEMSEIMASVNEGLFLVNKDLVIASQYSSRLEEILGQKDIGNKNLLDILRPLVPDSELEMAQTFIDQLYSDWVVEDLIEDLNPLHRISVQDEQGNGIKFLDFKFFRVWLGESIERVLVSVVDTTETVMLQASLDLQKEQQGRELEMLNIILNTDPTLMHNFVSGSIARLNDINQVLKQPNTNKNELHSKVHYIARQIHAVKGEASSLKLSRMVNICETFEESLQVMKMSNNLSGEDFLGLVVLLEDLYRLFDVLENYSSRVGNNLSGSNDTNAELSPEQIARKFAQTQEDYFKQFVADIAARHEKKAQLVMRGFDQNLISPEQWAQLKDVAIQLLRNSVVHGIELPETRLQRGKSQTGTIQLTLSQQSDGNLMLVAEDDGNGIDFNAIRRKAVVQGLVSVSQADAMQQQQLLSLMFSSGFSTVTQESEDAGRGVGMDIIKDIIKNMGGRINIATDAESYTRFSMTFPKK